MAFARRMTTYRGPGARAGDALTLVLTLWLAAAGLAMAQGAMGESGPDGPTAGEPAARDARPDMVGVSTLAPPDGDSGAAGTDAAPGADGAIGLIQAPEGAPVLPAEDMAQMPLLDRMAAPTMQNFAEVQPRARLFGPIDHPPVVLELFTSQGCSSCPPADEMLADLADRDDVLALSWHVDYWDYLGWADGFARPEFTRRQQAYAYQSGERAIYTPQMIVGGADTLIALRPAELMGLLQQQMARPSPVMVSAAQDEGGYRIELTPRARIPDRVAIILVRYAPSREVEVKAGENRGVVLDYRNVVLAAERVAEWDGRAPLRITVSPDTRHGDDFPGDTRHAILAQELGRGDPRSASGPILAAIRLD